MGIVGSVINIGLSMLSYKVLISTFQVLFSERREIQFTLKFPFVVQTKPFNLFNMG